MRNQQLPASSHQLPASSCELPVHTHGAVVCAFVAWLLLMPAAAHAQQAAPAPKPDDGALNVVQPDFTVINLPTTLRLPKMKSAFRVTHRFARSLTRGTFGQAAESFLGIDDGAQIGLECRFGVMWRAEAGTYPTRTDTIHLLGQRAARPRSAALTFALNNVRATEGRK